MDKSIEYSLNTPIFENETKNSLKILDLIKNSNADQYNMGNMIGGGLSNSNTIVIIIGIIIIALGFILYWYNNWKSTNATINSLICDNTQCKFNILYNVNNVNYNKIITLPISNKPTSSEITIYYEDTNPNVVRLSNYNYIGISLIILGIFVFIISLTLDYDKLDEPSSSGTDLFQKTKVVNGVNIVYS